MNPQKLHTLCRILGSVWLLTAVSGCQETLQGPSPHQISVERTRKTVTLLASDALEGRGVGTRGLDLAADYLAKELKDAKFQPLKGADGYFQHFSVRGEASVDPTTTLQMFGETLVLDTDYRPLAIGKAGSFSGPITFVGYAASSTEPAYNDFEGIDLSGRVALAMRYEPHDEKGVSRFTGKQDDWSSAASLSTKAEAAAKAGATALLVVNPPAHHGEDELAAFGRRRARGSAQIPVLQITREVADRLLAAGGVRDLASLQQLIDSELKPASAEIDDAQQASGKVEIAQKMIPVKNVVAMLPGRGFNADEYIVVGAHYDHLGFGERGTLAPATTRSIHNGADDNASGTAAILELCRRLGARKTPLQRSVLVIFFTGEERGLLGSDHFVNNPLVPLDKIHSMYNLDMVGRLKPNNEVAVGGRESAPGFQSMMNEVDAASPLKFVAMSGATFGSSDHASFMTKKIPALFLFTGLHSDYHRPTDDVEKINFEGIATVVDASEEIIRSLAVMPKQKFSGAGPRRPTTTTSPSTQEVRPQLGIVPSYTEDENAPDGVAISGTVPGTAAEAAGLQGGDVIQAINGKRLMSLEDMMPVFETAKVGDKLTMSVLRGKEVINLEATLRARQSD